jgi:hypothetical protein
MIFKLINAEVRQRAIQAIRQAPAGLIVRITESTRTLEQNAKIHAAISEFGRAIDWKFGGVQVDVDDLKSVLMAAFRKQQGHPARFVIGFDGQPVPLNWRTRDLSAKDASEFIEMIEYLTTTKGKT